MLDWLIIGGGVHGTYLSNLLLHEAGVPVKRLAVLDPFEVPLTAWRRRARACGMPYLRSPATHNIDLHILSIHRFAQTGEGRPYADFIPNYYRPSTLLFERHCDHVVRVRALARVRVGGRAREIRETAGGLTVATHAGDLEARRVILAIGPPERMSWPDWAVALRRAGAPVSHVFDPAYQRPEHPDALQTVIIGGGITAVQAALALAPLAPRRITLLSRQIGRAHV